MGWSTEGGGLRLPRFPATHALHVLPLAGFPRGGGRAIGAVAPGHGALLCRALIGVPLLA
ncbi:MAG: hypothetical protein Q8K20_21125 [Gemmobacter sp.]|nr:hypothetical protein [Gemmobacter sp.]